MICAFDNLKICDVKRMELNRAWCEFETHVKHYIKLSFLPRIRWNFSINAFE